jgi:iron complex outermembrane receptor protein
VVFQNPAETSAADNGSKNDLLSMSVEELMEVEIATVVGASRFEQQVTEAPASVSIVSADDIKKHGYRTLADALRSVRGIYVTYDRNYNYLGMRGFNRPGDLNTRTLLLVDGHRINDNIYESAPIGTEFPVDVDLIERIEVIRGPSSSLYGTNAFFGVINVITKRPGELQGTQLAAAAGSFETYNGRVSYGKEYAAGLGVLLSGSVLHSEGQDRLFYKEFETAGNDGVARHADGDKNYQLFSKLSYRDFSLTGVLSSRRKGIPTASYETVFNDPGTNTTDQYRFLDLKYAHTFAGDTDVSVRAFYDHYSFDGNYMYDHTDTGGPASVLNRDQAWGSWWGTEAQVTKTVSDWLKTTAGVEYRNNSKQQQRNYDQAPFFSYLDDKRHSSLWALYLQSEIRLLDSLILSAGVRHDQYDSFGGTTNPRVALIYKPLERSVFKLLYGRAFRAPSAFEFYYSDGGQTTKADQDLKPESIQTYEAVYEQYFLKHYRSSLSGFYYRIQDLISQQVDPADGLIQFVNAQNPIEAKGGELELEGTWDGGLRGRVSYTYQQVRDARTGVALSNSPRHLAKLNLVLPIMRDRLFLGAEEQYTSSRSTLAGNQTGDAYLTNATLSCRTPLQGLELILSVYNLFDRHYGDPGGAEHLQDVIRQDGRSFRVKLDYRF